MDKDSKGQRKLEDSGRRLLLAVKGHCLKWRATAGNEYMGEAD